MKKDFKSISILLVGLLVGQAAIAQWSEYNMNTTVGLEGVYVKEDGKIYIAGEMGFFKQSTDCGNTWSDVEITYLGDLGKILFINQSVGFVLGDDGAYGKTIDGGLSWTFSSTPAPDNLENLFFIDEEIGYMVGKDGGIVKTINGGNSWTLLSSGVTSRLQGVHFFNESDGVVTGRNSTALMTSDGGVTWSIITTGFSGDLSSISFLDEETGFIAGEGGIYEVNSDLMNVSFIPLTLNGEYSDICFIDQNNGFVCGDLGEVYFTNNGGLDWELIETEGMPFELSAIHGISPDHVFTVGDIGKVNGICNITDIDEFDQKFKDVSVRFDSNNLILLMYLNQEVDVDFTVIDLSGRLVADRKLHLNQGNVEILFNIHISPGLYLVRIEEDNLSWTKKVIKL